MLVKEIMRKDVKIVRPDDNVMEAAKIMNQYRIGSLVVVDGKGHIEGILTERDIMKGVNAESLNSADVKVSEIMTKKVIVISPDISLEEAADIMTQYKIKKLPVVEGGQLVGIVTSSDLISYEKNLVEKISFLLGTAEQPTIEGKSFGG
jgi:CBS domain-containing protein